MKLRFEWDKKKNADCIKKHGVSFKEADKVFLDPKRIEIYDEKHSIYEDRWKMIGLCNSKIYTVIYTERNGIIRIISAREAEKNEEEAYFYGYGKIYN